MTTINLHSKTDAEGKLVLDKVSVGVPNADVSVDVTVLSTARSEEFRARLEKAAASIDPTLWQRYPKSTLQDPWEAT